MAAGASAASAAVMSRAKGTSIALASLVIGVGSLLALVGFLFVGSFGIVDLGLGRGAALSLDAGLCLLFFLQHSGMIRERARLGLARIVAPSLYRAAYAIASGLALLALVVLWQPTGGWALASGGGAAWASRAVFLLSVAGFVWAMRSLSLRDPFGVQGAVARDVAQETAPSALRTTGAYRWVRHPLYLSALVMIWSRPAPSADRLLFNALWTGWIVVGSLLEERDLVRDLGDGYKDYRSRVPMLFPLRLSFRRSRRAGAAMRSTISP
jgi:protein-S-isoprenylcysteine O-methyltransferase Ste14